MWLPPYKVLLINLAAFHVHNSIKQYRMFVFSYYLNFKLTFPKQGWIWSCLFKMNDNTTLNLLDQRLQTLVQHPLSPHTVRSAWEKKQPAQVCGDALLARCLLAIADLPATLSTFLCLLCWSLLEAHIYIKGHAKPPVTSHIWVMAESSVGTLPSCSLSGLVAPGNLSTNANRRWSQRKGSLVSSLPTSGEFRGRCSWKDTKGIKRWGNGSFNLQWLFEKVYKLNACDWCESESKWTTWPLTSLSHLIGHPRVVCKLISIGDSDDNSWLKVKRVTTLRKKHSVKRRLWPVSLIIFTVLSALGRAKYRYLTVSWEGNTKLIPSYRLYVLLVYLLTGCMRTGSIYGSRIFFMSWSNIKILKIEWEYRLFTMISQTVRQRPTWQGVTNLPVTVDARDETI